MLEYFLQVVLIFPGFHLRQFYLACVNDDEEETYAQHGDVGGEQEIPQDDQLFENYFNFDDDNYLVRELNACLFHMAMWYYSLR